MQNKLTVDCTMSNARQKLARYWQILLFGVLVIAGLWCFLFAQVHYEYELGINNAAREGSNLALVFEDYVVKVLRNVDHGSLKMKIAVETQQELARVLPPILAAMREEPAILRASVFDEFGDVVISLPPSPGKIHISDREFFQVHRRGAEPGLYVSSPIVGRLIRQPIMPISRRINRPDGSFGGVVVVSLDADYFTDFFKQLELGPDKRLAIVGTDGQTKLIQEHDNRRAGYDISRSELFQAVRTRSRGTLVAASALDGVRLVNNFRLIPQYGLYVNVAIPESFVLDELAHRKQNYFLITALASLFVAAFCAGTIRRLQRQAADHCRMSMLQQTTGRLVRADEQADSLLQLVLQDAVTLVGADGGLISMLDTGAKTWTLRFAIGLVGARPGARFSADQGMTGAVMQSGQQLYVEDYRHYAGKLDNPAFAGVSSVIMIPMQSAGRTIGVLSAAWLGEIRHLSAEEQDAFRQYAILAMVALDANRNRQQVQKLAYTDVLTDLPNRRAAYEYLETALNQSCDGPACGAVLFIDIDELKVVNDSFGHACGDQLLVQASRRLLDSVDATAFVARLAGDEFVAVLPGAVEAETVEAVAKRIVSRLSGPYELAEASVHVSASAGIALYPADGKTVGDILKNADAALYAGKITGKGAWNFYDSRLQQESVESLRLLNSLHGAIDKNELSVQFQPQMYSNGQVAGFEALLRWSSPEHGFVSPAKFIPLAEKSRLISVLGEWVLHETCLFIAQLAAEGRQTLRVSVNVSARQFDFVDFSEIVQKHIGLTGIAPSQLVVEITESAFMESIEACNEQLNKIRAMGVGISLDDFGKGYSSLTLLRQLPLGTLKIDKTFIDNIHTDEKQRLFIASVVAMAHALGMKVCAEGVELKEQLERVVECDCDIIQGYYFSKPITSAQAMDFAAARQNGR